MSVSQKRSGLRRAFGGYDPNVEQSAERAANFALVIGYLLAIVSGLRLRSTWRDRNLRRFVMFEVGTGLVAFGLALRRKWALAAANAATAGGLAALWVIAGRRPAGR